jgi:hypothetical protein
MANDTFLEVMNSDGVVIISENHRNMEVIARGSVEISAPRGMQTITWPACDCPILFLRTDPGALMFRGLTPPYGGSCVVTADRPTTMSYIVGGFRTDAGPNDNDHGVDVWDAAGRLAFSTQRPYLRLPRPLPLIKSYATPSYGEAGVFRLWDVDTPGYPLLDANTFLSFPPSYCWDKDGGSMIWYAGVGINSPTQFVVMRFDISSSAGLYPLPSSPPSTMGLSLDMITWG